MARTSVSPVVTAAAVCLFMAGGLPVQAGAARNPALQTAAQARAQTEALAKVNASLANLTLQITRLREQVDTQGLRLERLQRQLDRVVTPDSNVGAVRPVETTHAGSKRLPPPPPTKSPAGVVVSQTGTPEGLVFDLLGCLTTAAGSRCTVAVLSETTTGHMLDLSIVGVTSYLVKPDLTHLSARGAILAGTRAISRFGTGDATLVTIDFGVPLSGTLPKLVVSYRVDGRAAATTFAPVVFSRVRP